MTSHATGTRIALIELFSIIYAEGLWSMLSPDVRALGEQLYKEETGNELSVPPGAMKYSIEQHIELIDRLLPGNHKATDFWKTVTQIVWMVVAIEKNPLLASEIRDSENPTALIEALETRSRA